MNENTPESAKDGIILLARFLLVLLFIIFGWDKLTDYHGTVAYMQMTGAPIPALSAVIAIIMEFIVGLAIFLACSPVRSPCCWRSIRSPRRISATITGP